MSRTAHHIRRKYWNVKQVERCLGWETEPVRIGNHTYQFIKKPRTLVYKEELWEVGHELYDLRFYAGCKRVPQNVRRAITLNNWLGHGGGSRVQIYMDEYWGGHRAAGRSYGKEVKKAHRAGELYDDILEPEGRHRHQAIYDAW